MTVASGTGTGALPPDIASQIKAQEHELLIAGQRLGNFDKVRQRTFFSSYLFTPGRGGTIPAAEYKVFQAVVGDTGQGYPAAISKRETNWVSRGRIADNHNLLIKQISVQVRRGPTDPNLLTTAFVSANNLDPLSTPSPHEIALVARSFQLGVTYLTNTVPIGLLADYPAAGGGYGWAQQARQEPHVAVGAPNTLPDASPNLADVRAILPVTRNATVPMLERRYKVPILLQHGETFGMSLILPRQLTFPGVNTEAVNPDRFGNLDTAGMVEVVVQLFCTESFVEKS